MLTIRETNTFDNLQDYQKTGDTPFSCLVWWRSCWKYWKADSDKLSVYIMHLKGGVEAVWPMIRAVKWGVKYMRFVSRRFYTDYNYPLETGGKLTDSDFTSIFDKMLETCTFILLENVKEDSPLGKYLQTIGKMEYKVVEQNRLACPGVETQYFDSKKLSTSLLATIRAQEKIHLIKFEVVTKKSEFARLLDIYLLLNKAWWSARGSKGVAPDRKSKDFLKEVLTKMFNLNLILCTKLTSEKRILSISINMCDSSTLYLYSNGHSVNDDSLSLGSIYLYHLLNFAKERFTKVDFMRGDESYKYRWQTRDSWIRTVKIYAKHNKKIQ